MTRSTIDEAHAADPIVCSPETLRGIEAAVEAKRRAGETAAETIKRLGDRAHELDEENRLLLGIKATQEAAAVASAERITELQTQLSGAEAFVAAHRMDGYEGLAAQLEAIYQNQIDCIAHWKAAEDRAVADNARLRGRVAELERDLDDALRLSREAVERAEDDAAGWRAQYEDLAGTVRGLDRLVFAASVGEVCDGVARAARHVDRKLTDAELDQLLDELKGKP